MDEKQFHKRLKEILNANRDPNNSPDEQFHEMMNREVVAKSKSEWDEDVAMRVMQQFEWATDTQPKRLKLSEDNVKKILNDFLAERSYRLTAIPEITTKTPDSYIEGHSEKYLCEIKSPELLLDIETQLYKFKTTHRKILDFIHTAVKQFDALSPSHDLPRVLVFTSVSPQLNWKSFTDAIQGGVVDQQGKVLPDFSMTPVYKNSLPLLADIDLYVWYQIGSDTVHQASYFLNDNSKYLDTCKALISNLSQPKASSMDNAYFVHFDS